MTDNDQASEPEDDGSVAPSMTREYGIVILLALAFLASLIVMLVIVASADNAEDAAPDTSQSTPATEPADANTPPTPVTPLSSAAAPEQLTPPSPPVAPLGLQQDTFNPADLILIRKAFSSLLDAAATQYNAWRFSDMAKDGDLINDLFPEGTANLTEEEAAAANRILLNWLLPALFDRSTPETANALLPALVALMLERSETEQQPIPVP